MPDVPNIGEYDLEQINVLSIEVLWPVIPLRNVNTYLFNFRLYFNDVPRLQLSQIITYNQNNKETLSSLTFQLRWPPVCSLDHLMPFFLLCAFPPLLHVSPSSPSLETLSSFPRLPSRNSPTITEVNLHRDIRRRLQRKYGMILCRLKIAKRKYVKLRRECMRKNGVRLK